MTLKRKTQLNIIRNYTYNNDSHCGKKKEKEQQKRHKKVPDLNLCQVVMGA